MASIQNKIAGLQFAQKISDQASGPGVNTAQMKKDFKALSTEGRQAALSELKNSPDAEMRAFGMILDDAVATLPAYEAPVRRYEAPVRRAVSSG